MKTTKSIFSLAPATTLTVAAILAIGLAMASMALAVRSPWLGIGFDRDYAGEGVRVKSVAENGPASGKLKSGDIIQAFQSASQDRFKVSSVATMEDADYSTSYTEYNSFLEIQQRLWNVISSPSFTAILDDNRQVIIYPENFTRLNTLPSAFWWLLVFGAASFVLGAGVWSLRSEDVITRVLAISGMGFMIASYTCGIYVARELTIPGNRFFALVAISHLGLVIFSYAAILTFWYYPRKLSNAPAIRLFAVWGAFVWLNETLQWWTWPGHPFYSHLVVAYLFLVLFTCLQWINSRGTPDKRAMLRWMLGTMTVTLGLNVVLFCIPIIMTGKPITSTTLTFGSVFVFFFGLVIGNIRYKQFDFEHWWFRAWKWMLLLLMVTGVDAGFVYLLQLSQYTSITLTIAMVSLYLALRQWFWNKYSGKDRRMLDRALPHFVNALTLRQMMDPAEQQWRELVERVFAPLSIKSIPDALEKAEIDRGGLVLRLPGMDALTSLELFCCENGKRLFTNGDIKLSSQLIDLIRQSRNLYDMHEQGVQQERIRIQRDLHDDVAARLLTLIHLPSDPVVSKVASSAMRGLREVIHLLGAEEALIEDVMSDIEAGAREQLAGLAIHLEWKAPDSWPPIMLNTQQHINLRRIARETIANALKHAAPRRIVMEVFYESKQLVLRIGNDDPNTDPAAWIPGRGLNNIKARVKEIGGSHEWGIEQKDDNRQYCYLLVKIPLSPGE